MWHTKKALVLMIILLCPTGLSTTYATNDAVYATLEKFGTPTLQYQCDSTTNLDDSYPGAGACKAYHVAQYSLDMDGRTVDISVYQLRTGESHVLIEPIITKLDAIVAGKSSLFEHTGTDTFVTKPSNIRKCDMRGIEYLYRNNARIGVGFFHQAGGDGCYGVWYQMALYSRSGDQLIFMKFDAANAAWGHYFDNMKTVFDRYNMSQTQYDAYLSEIRSIYEDMVIKHYRTDKATYGMVHILKELAAQL